jgi:hypothetical protein
MLSISSKQKKLGITLGVILAVFLLAGISYVFPTATNQGYAPEQPIPFSHKIHAGINKIQCQYCHSEVEKSRHAGIPSLNVCMNCHSVVKTDSPYIKQVRAAWDAKKPIEWIRVHELPDYVYFPHKRHVAKGITCETCHGNVKEMDRIQQHAPLTMGWCMECHRGQTTPKQVMARIYPNMKNPHGQVAPTNCDTCHD